MKPTGFTFSLLICTFLVWGFSTSDASVHPFPDNTHTNKANPDGKKIVAYAASFLGHTQERDALASNGFGSQGFARYVFAKFGYYLPADFHRQLRVGKRIGKRRAKEGDLIYFKASKKLLDEPAHVGIVVSQCDGGITFIHQSAQTGVRFDTLESAFYKDRLLGFRRITTDNRPISSFLDE